MEAAVGLHFDRDSRYVAERPMSNRGDVAQAGGLGEQTAGGNGYADTDRTSLLDRMLTGEVKHTVVSELPDKAGPPGRYTAAPGGVHPRASLPAPAQRTAA